MSSPCAQLFQKRGKIVRQLTADGHGLPRARVHEAKFLRVQALAALPGSLTVFIVSQRAASLQHADQILVLDDGRLVGLGTHDQLRQSCPVYEEIYESQFKKGDVQK